MTPINQSNVIAAYFRDPNDAERAISNLSGAGFSKKDIGVAITDHAREGQSSSKPSGWAQRLRSMFSPGEREEYDSHDALDVLDHMGISENDGRYFRNALAHGGALITVKANGRANEASAILKTCNAITSEKLASEKFAQPESGIKREGTQRMELLGETLRVNKERVQRGSVTLRKEVVSEPQNIEVPVEREELVIERHPAGGDRTTSATLEEGKELRVPLSEERVQVEKRPVVREEVEVGKRTVRDTEKITDDVRREKLKVEKEGDVSPDETRQRKTG